MEQSKLHLFPVNLATSYIYILQSFWRVNGEIPSNLDFLFLVVVPYKIKPGINNHNS